MNGCIHQMTFEGKDANGVDEYYCTICGYHFKMTWPPNYHREIITPSPDPNARHAWGFSDTDLDVTVNAEITKKGEPPDPYLDPWEQYMKGRGGK